MLTAHKGMNISAIEFMAALGDALNALDKNGIEQGEKEEVLKDVPSPWVFSTTFWIDPEAHFV